MDLTVKSVELELPAARPLKLVFTVGVLPLGVYLPNQLREFSHHADSF
ncbi:hypothetical protein M595_2469 [Lyngbya aestuarii BL J]|uniref:Uncharacterized protein n=1 Tax=Lyngbya aestuarii BL J TaxID=1348334 RepID=U7QJX1_9CYAN|nr:hypothetical protein M595_2469 [Lyngbya aestuarii BL J]